MDKKPMQKKEARLRRARRARAHILELRAFRLTVHRTPSHIYAQIIAPEGGKVVVAASTLEAEVKKGLKHCGNVTAAQAVGKAIADKAKKAGITAVAFDRSGFRYHGRVKALADAARENGLQF
jgi:large subunit ribosomal protein L18